MKLQLDDIEKTLVQVITAKSKLPVADAKIIAGDYIAGELNGKASHGLAAFIALIPSLAGEYSDTEIIKESESALYIDAHNNFGSVVGRKAADALRDKAAKQGVALAYIRNMRSWLRPAAIAEYIADFDMVSLVTNTGGPPMVAPPGGKDPVIGTNPIGIGIPAQKQPVIVDMATSKRAWGEVRQAKLYGHDLPADSYYDRNGQIAVTPDDAYSALPMGEYKGFALGLFIEIMGGAFVDMPMGEGDLTEAYYARTRGATIIVLDPNFTVGTEAFKTANQAFIDSIRASSPLPASNGVTLPGDRAAKTKAAHLRDGYIDVNDKLWREITKHLTT